MMWWNIAAPIINGRPWGQLLFEKIPEWLLLKGSYEDILILKALMVTHSLHFLLWSHGKEEQVFKDLFFSKCFCKKYETHSISFNFHSKNSILVNPDKTGLFEGSFSWGKGRGGRGQLIKNLFKVGWKLKNAEIICYMLTSLDSF